jgi:signal transduction histidine kinase
MKITDEILPISILEKTWLSSPWGIAIINSAGEVHAVNPSFEKCTEISEAEVLGMSEAAFSALFSTHLPERRKVERRRVENSDGSFRAIHYFSDAEINNERDMGCSRAAELLREPLASVYGFAELLLSQNYDEDTRLMLTRTLLEQVEVMSNLINEQLDTSNKQ